MRGNRYALVFVLVLLRATACVPSLQLTQGAQLTCANDDECPLGSFCLDDVGLCSEGGPCLVQGEETVVEDGTACGEEEGLALRCVRGVCAAPQCGDGLLDLDAGEQCDFGVDARCREDCTPRVCGDLTLDDGESCDDLSLRCRGCMFGCNGDALSADCDLDPSTQCECAVERLESFGTDDDIIGAAFIEGGYVFANMKGEDNYIDVVRVKGGERTVIGTDLLFGDVARIGQRTFIGTGDGDVSVVTVEEAGGAPRELARRNDGVLFRYFTASDTRLFERTGGGIYEIDVDTGAERFVKNACTGDFDAAGVCGDRFVCFDLATSQLSSFDFDGENERVHDTAPDDSIALIPACIGSVLHWHDDENLYREDASGERILVASVGDGGLATFGWHEARLVAGHLLFFTMHHARFAEGSLFALDLERNSISVVYEGILLDEQDGVVLVGNDTGQLHRFTLAVGP